MSHVDQLAHLPVLEGQRSLQNHQGEAVLSEKGQTAFQAARRILNSKMITPKDLAQTKTLGKD